MKGIIVLAITLAIAACAPAATTPFDPTADITSFTLNVDGAPAVRSGGSFRFGSADFALDVTLERDRVLLDLTNNTDRVLRLHPAGSTFVLPDGVSSVVVTGATSWTTRDDPQPPIEVPAGATTRQTLIPRTNLDFTDELVIAPIFEWPLAARTSISLVLSMEFGDDPEEVVLVFTGSNR